MEEPAEPWSGSIANRVVTVREQQTSTHGSQLARRLAAAKALSRDKLTSISLLCSWRPWWSAPVEGKPTSTHFIDLQLWHECFGGGEDLLRLLALYIFMHSFMVQPYNNYCLEVFLFTTVYLFTNVMTANADAGRPIAEAREVEYRSNESISHSTEY